MTAQVDSGIETAISRQIRKALEVAGYWPMRLPSGTARGGGVRMCQAGTPDLMVIGKRAGVLCFLEVKTASGELSASQILWHEQGVRRGCRVYVVRSVREALESVAEAAKARGDVA